MEDKVSVHTARLVGCREEVVGLQDQVKAAQQAADLVLIIPCTGSAHVFALVCCYCHCHCVFCTSVTTESIICQVLNVGSVLIDVVDV